MKMRLNLIKIFKNYKLYKTFKIHNNKKIAINNFK